jgi:hypothetical protein
MPADDGPEETTLLSDSLASLHEAVGGALVLQQICNLEQAMMRNILALGVIFKWVKDVATGTVWQVGLG